MSADALLSKLRLVLGDRLFDSVKIAYLKAEDAHKKQKLRNGNPYIMHPLRVAIIIADELNIKEENIISIALLHDVLEDTSVSVEEIEYLFGKKVAEGVNLLTKSDQFNDNIEHQRKYFWHLKRANKKIQLAKLADRLDNMRELEEGSTTLIIKKYCLDTTYNYLDWAKKISPYIAAELEDLLFIYGEKYHKFTG